MTRKLFSIVALLMLLAGGAFAQSTTVTVNVTDQASQAWANGSVSFLFTRGAAVPQTPYVWSGGVFNQLSPLSAVLNGSGSGSKVVPSNSAFTPNDSTYVVTVCSNTFPATCFTTNGVVITGSTQTLNIAPPPISIAVPTSPGLVVVNAYADSEIVGGWNGFIYTNVNVLTSPQPRICQVVSAGSCSTWANNGGGAGSGTVTQAALVVPTWLNVSGSPITNSGTFTVTAAAAQTSHQVIGTCNTLTAFAPCLLVAADLPATAVTPGSYTAANITVDQQGRITTAANGSGGSSGISGQSANCIPKAATATTLTSCSSGSDNGTTFTVTEPVASTSLTSCNPLFNVNGTITSTPSVFLVECYGGGTPQAQANNCITAAIAVNGACDFGAWVVGNPQTFTGPVLANLTTNQRLTIILPASCDWKVNITNGTDSLFEIGGGSVKFDDSRTAQYACQIQNISPANGLFAFVTVNGSTTNYTDVKGLFINNSVTTASTYDIEWLGSVDNSYIQHNQITDTADPGGHTQGLIFVAGGTNTVCCGMFIDHNILYGSDTSSTLLQITAASNLYSIFVTNNSIGHPGTGKFNFQCTDGSGHVSAVYFWANYEELSRNGPGTVATNSNAGCGLIDVRGSVSGAFVASTTSPLWISSGNNIQIHSAFMHRVTQSYTLPATVLSNSNALSCTSSPCLIKTDSVGVYGEASVGANYFSGMALGNTTYSSAHTATIFETNIDVTGTTTISIDPTLLYSFWNVTNIGSNTITVSPLSGTINGSASLTLAANAMAGNIHCNGTNCWTSTATGSGAVASVSNSDGSLAISPTTGAVVASLNLAHANTFTAGQTMPSLTLTGPTAGADVYTCAPTNTVGASGTITIQAPATCSTAYLLNLVQTAATGILHWSLSGSTVTPTSSAVNLASADVTGLLPHANIAATAVTPGSYTAANITVAADGSLTAAANGSGGGFAGTVTYTANQTASSADNNKLVIMNCAGACAYKLPNAQPSTTWTATFISIGATNATIALDTTATFNQSTTAPSTPVKWQPTFIAANTQTSTDYVGQAPIEPGQGITFGANSSNTQINASTGASSATVASRNTTLAAQHVGSFGGNGTAPLHVLLSSYPATIGVGCSTPTTIQYAITYIDQNANTVTLNGATLLHTIATNGGPTDTTAADLLNVTLTLPANINNSTGIQYATTYTAGTCTTTNPSYAAAIKVIF